MRWPWSRQGLGEHMVLSWSDRSLTYVLACVYADGACKVIRYGVEKMGTGSMDELFQRLAGLVPKGVDVRVMLQPEQYQLVQIPAPAVAPEELRSAARYQVREMLHAHMDDVTLDVMRVGDGQQKGAGHLFVVAATNAVLRGILDLGEAMRWSVSVIDIQETAQRNLQNAFASREGRVDRASAALVLLDQHQALLTISAHGELFYTRRFDFPEDFLASALLQDKELLPGYPGDDSRREAIAQEIGEEDNAQRFLVEVQRSLDLWDRVWSGMPLHEILVYAGERSEALSRWLSSQLAQTVLPMDINTLFPGFEGGNPVEKTRYLPLLGLLLRDENRTL